MAIEIIDYKSDWLVEYNGTTDVASAAALNNADDGATCSFSVYDPAKDESFSEDEASGQTVLSVSNPGVFVVGDIAEAVMDDETIHDCGAVTVVAPAAGTITVTNAIDDDAAEGNRIRVRLGDAITMSFYGTKKLNSLNPPWGFRGTLPDTHPGLTRGLTIRIETNFIGDAGGGLDRHVFQDARIADA